MQPEIIEAIRKLIRSSPYAWCGLFAVLATIYAMARVGSWLAIAVASWPLRRYRGDSWSERARLAWPSRRIGIIALMVVGTPAFLAFARSAYGLQLLSPIVLMVTASALGVWGVLETVIRRESRLNPAYALTPSPARAARISWFLMLGPIFLGIVVLNAILPDHVNKVAILILVTMALGFGSYLAWGRLALMRLLGVIRPASDRLRAIVQQTVGNDGVLPHAVLQVGLPMANAFAFTLEGTLGVSDAALAVLDDEELGVVCAHEMAHLREPRRIVWARASRLFLIGVYMAMLAATVRPLPGSFGPSAYLWGFIAATVLFFVGIKLSNRLSLKMEHLADARATESQASPGVYARALEKLYRANLAPAVFRSKRMTHPHLYDRMIQAGVTPDYPRPPPPPLCATWLGLATLVFAVWMGTCAYRLVTRTLPDALLEQRTAILWRIGGGELELPELLELLELLKVQAATRHTDGASR